MTLHDYKTVLYGQEDGSWVAEIPALPGCYALMTLQSEKTGPVLRTGQFHELSLDWDCELNVANLQIDSQYMGTLLGLEKAQGLAYLRLSSAAPATDKKGFWVSNLRTEVQP